jgi:hypothetical protein
MKYQCGFFLAVMLLAFIPLNAQYIRTPDPVLKHNEKTFGNKMIRGSAYSLGYNAVIMTTLILSPEYISQWDRKEVFKSAAIREQYRLSFTTPPVKDNDLFIVNYVGHPYQGSFYYNAVRSQGARIWQSSLFAIMQSVLWEYVWEGGLEQPSIQDLIITPLGGILLGELSHRATLAMGKNGFQWYEIILTCIINPAYAFNNGFTRPASGGN